ncbi:hypothetical protein LIER_04959 [Lithospermum erythrorhizon]|uniref:Uncharacterized protein n=1 Tax=Lithospermum erythrorhizon TaxID=34254 RepID=A0AAV3P0K7_LITER
MGASEEALGQEVFMKVATVILHLVYLGVLLIFDKGFVDKFSTDPWYTAIYLLLFVATLAWYFRSPDLIHAWMLFRAVAAVNFLGASAL